MKRITILPFPEPGHFMPTIRIAQRLQKHGHVVTYLSLPEFESFFREHGLSFQPLFAQFADVLDDCGMFAVHNTGDGILKKCVLHGITTHTGRRGLQSLVRTALESVRSDLLFCDVLMLNYFGDALHTNTRSLVSFNTSLPHAKASYSPELVLCPLALDPYGSEHESDARYYVEPSVHRARPEIPFSWDAIDSRKALVYCSFGTQVAMYPAAEAVLRSVVNAFRRLKDFQLVASIGRLKWDSREALPDNVLLVPSAPQLELLARAKLFITHGGLGGIKEAVMEAVPMLVIPFNADQPANGKRIEALGLGAMCPIESSTHEAIASILQNLCETASIRSRMCEMRDIFWMEEHRSPSVEFLLGRLPL